MRSTLSNASASITQAATRLRDRLAVWCAVTRDKRSISLGSGVLDFRSDFQPRRRVRISAECAVVSALAACRRSAGEAVVANTVAFRPVDVSPTGYSCLPRRRLRREWRDWRVGNFARCRHDDFPAIACAISDVRNACRIDPDAGEFAGVDSVVPAAE